MKTLHISNQILTEDSKKSFLSADASSGDSSIDVENIAGFSTDQFLLIETFGNEKAEIVQTHSSTSPSDGTVTLDSGLDFDHNQGAKVTVIGWDKIEVSHADTEDGSKTVLSTIDIQPDQLETQYEDDTKNSGFYFTRFKNSISGNYSSYSDPIPFGDWSEDQVGFIINYALKKNGLDTFTDKIDKEFCLTELNLCLQKIHGKRKRWHPLQKFDYELGTLTEDENTIDCPDEMWGYSRRSILDIRLEDERALNYLTEREYNDRKTDETGEPRYFTVKDNQIHLLPIPDSDAAGTKVIVDFWTEAPKVDSMADEIDGLRYDMLVHYLIASIRGELNNNGQIPADDTNYQKFTEALQDALIRENQTHGQDYPMKPNLNTIDYPNA